MSVFSSGKKWKKRAEGAINAASAIEDEQREIEFRRQLLSNIRQERIARAQLDSMHYSDDFMSSSAAGATANIDSSLAGETIFSYESSKRQQQMTDLNKQAERYYKKYQKQQKTRAAAFSVAGIAVGALAGGALGAAGMLGAGVGGMSGSIMGAQIGQGFGQIASGTGQWQQGLGNIISGGTQIWSANQVENSYQRLLTAFTGNYTDSYQTPAGYGRYEAFAIHPNTRKLDLGNAEQFLLPEPNGTTFKGCGGYYR